MPRTTIPANVVGPQIRKVRYRRAWTQEQFAARCQIRGLDISRATLAQIESQFRYVSDEELFAIASALEIDIIELYPPSMRRRRKR
jgi:transcriptional regulator with XRE-family HTH domain